VLAPARKVVWLKKGSTTPDVCRGETSFLILAKNIFLNLFIHLLVDLPVVAGTVYVPFNSPNRRIRRRLRRIQPDDLHFGLAGLAIMNESPFSSLIDQPRKVFFAS